MSARHALTKHSFYLRAQGSNLSIYFIYLIKYNVNIISRVLIALYLNLTGSIKILKSKVN